MLSMKPHTKTKVSSFIYYRDYGYGRDEPMMRDRSPIRGSDDRFSDRFRKDDK